MNETNLKDLQINMLMLTKIFLSANQQYVKKLKVFMGAVLSCCYTISKENVSPENIIYFQKCVRLTNKLCLNISFKERDWQADSLV